MAEHNLDTQEMLRLEYAFRAAIKADDTEAANRFGQAIRKLRDEPDASAVPMPTEAAPEDAEQGSFLDPLTQGVTFGGADEIKGVGGMFAKFLADVSGQGLEKSSITGEDFTYGDAYANTRDSAREDAASFEKRNPKTSLGLEVVGSLATGGLGFAKATGTQAFKQAPKLKQALTVAKVSGAEGAAYGFGKGEGIKDSLVSSLEEGAKGAVLGPAIQKVSQVVVPLVKGVSETAKKMQEKIMPGMNLSELKAYSKSLFKQLDNKKVEIKLQPYQKFAKRVVNEIEGIGISGSSRGTMRAGMVALEKPGELTFTELFRIRKLFSSARLGSDKQLRKAANKATKQIDEFMGSLKNDDILSGDVSNVKTILSDAQDTWSRQAQASTLEDVMERASRSEAALAGESDVAIRSKLRSIMDSDRKSLAFDDDALAAMDNIIIGTPTKAKYRKGAEMAPGSRTARGGAPTTAAAAFGAMKTGKAEAMLVFAALPSIVGGMFRSLANKGTKGEIDILMNSIINKNQPELEKIISRISRKYSADIGMSATALSTAILGNLDASPGGFSPDEKMTSLGDMISP